MAVTVCGLRQVVDDGEGHMKPRVNTKESDIRFHYI